LREVDDSLLRGIRRDDFQVTALAERKQGVARAAAGMDSADGGADPGVLFDELHAEIEVVATENDVIEQSRHLVFFRVVRAQDMDGAASAAPLSARKIRRECGCDIVPPESGARSSAQLKLAALA